MLEPPFHSGAFHVRPTEAPPGVAITSVGESGTVRGVTDELGSLAAESPATLLATTVKVYA